ncbi:ABC transporter ATP-binding protein [Pontibacillus marinus]|uniref:ABC transporter ATP-binding protein n=1 Tax=Pontibacillus marinus BH030004 = DSM 16465 TaxID=1385511 RepID=A0A0A5HUX2_9BACI|nr:ABC transporter ATP-binding protein [Pontibacillus marinus]KGX87427.1 ABC transporter ATP-binding protein [Pontibacillus marinus BH030004 = DSM 16465]
MAFVSVDQLSKTFDKTAVIKDLSFQLEKGKCVSLLGQNGAGKTTTLRMLSGLMKPTKGTISIDGASPSSDIRSFIGYLPQHPVFHNWMTGKEFLVYVGRLAHLSKKEATTRAESLLKQVGIEDAKNRRIGKYSGGMKQRLGIAQAMIHKPKLIMLDEPVSSLDPVGRREVLTLLEELKQETTVLFSTHILSDAEEVSDELLLLHDGHIVESGTMDDLQSQHDSTRIDLSFSKEAHAFEVPISQIDSVENVQREGNQLHIYAKNIENARTEILKLASEQDWPMTKFEVSRTSLEDLFMKVVNQ